MAKFQSPLLGFNNNIRHRGREFHVQTEDSGVNHPHVITHLFMDGGRILKSVKKSYAEHVGADTMKETVKVLMKEQHKAMFIALRDGQFDELVGFAPGEGIKGDKAAPKPEAVAAPAPPATAPELPPVVEEPPPNTIAERPAVEPFALDTSGPQTVPEPVAPEPARAPSQPYRPSAAELTLDFDALERDSTPSPMFQAHDLPPPPKNLFAKERGTGAYSTLHDNDGKQEKPDTVRKPPARTSVAPPSRERGTGAYSTLHDNHSHDDNTRKPGRPSVVPPSRSGGEAGRYAAARPASIFGSTLKPAAPASSVFGDDLVSDKSLDEVILSYLAEDLDPRGK